MVEQPAERRQLALDVHGVVGGGRVRGHQERHGEDGRDHRRDSGARGANNYGSDDDDKMSDVSLHHMFDNNEYDWREALRVVWD